MDDPTRWCENDTNKWRRATRGPCSQARASFLFAVERLVIAANWNRKSLQIAAN
jgi:hypothetical protein